MDETERFAQACRSAYQLGYNDGLKACANVAQSAANIRPQDAKAYRLLAEAFLRTAESESHD